MSAVIRKKNSKNTETQLRKIAIVDQLKRNKSSAIYRKFLMSITPFTYSKSQILRYDSEQPIKLIFITQGSVNYTLSLNMQKKQVKAPNYLVLDKQIQFAKIGQENTLISQLPQKYMYQYFEGIIQFPLLQQKLNFLKQISLFKQFSRKTLIKISMETIELNLVIGGTVYKERQEADSLFIIVRGQVVLMKNSKKISYIGTKQIFGHSKIQLSMVKVLKKRQLQVKQYAEHLDSQKANSFSQNIQTFCHKNLKPQQYQEKEVEIQLYQQSAKVISDRAIIYKINKSMLQSLNNMFSHVSLSSAYTKPKQKGTQTNLVKNTANIKQMKWRQQRLTNELNFQKQSIQLRNRKQKMSFFQKHTILKSFYNSESSLTPRKIQFHKINSKDKTYNSQQQYYDIALSTLKRLRKQKYGEDFQDGKVTVLFPLKLEQKFNKRFRTQTIISNRCKKLSNNSKSKSKQKENQMSRTLNLVKMWRNNFKASKSP